MAGDSPDKSQDRSGRTRRHRKTAPPVLRTADENELPASFRDAIRRQRVVEHVLQIVLEADPAFRALKRADFDALESRYFRGDPVAPWIALVKASDERRAVPEWVLEHLVD